MKTSFITDYGAYILFRWCGPLIRLLPIRVALFLGRCLGEFYYYFDFKHRAIAYANIKSAFKDKLLPKEISKINKNFYGNFGQNFMEIFIIPLVDKAYLDKYITIEGLENISEGFKRGKGIILLGMHEGSWELSNIISANLGFPFSLFFREQRYPHLDRLLNSYRSAKGCKIIQRENQLRQLIGVLKNNEAMGMTVDQGGKTGLLVKFFGKDASMATGALRIALKYDTVLIPVFFTRIKGPYLKIFIEQPFVIKRTGDLDKDISNNLEELINIFERYILRYPGEYLWSYKIWKYAQEKSILILSDGKTGHLRQAEAVAGIVSDYLKDKSINTYTDTVEIKFKNKFSRLALTLSCVLANKFTCQGCLSCLKTFLNRDVYRGIIRLKPDIIISCGSSSAGINFILSQENLAKSIVIMRPSLLSTRRFDMVIMPQHDNPPKRNNVIITEGALNLIDDVYLKEQIDNFMQVTNYQLPFTSYYISLIIGGDTKKFHLEKPILEEVIRQIKSAAESLNLDILITTSRRTQGEIENLLKEEFINYPRCKLLVIANEKNIPSAMGGILGLSQIIITSPESISMISEAAQSKKYVLVFNIAGLGIRHRRFLQYFAKNKYIYLTEPKGLAKQIQELRLNKPEIFTTRDNFLIREALKKIL